LKSNSKENFIPAFLKSLVKKVTKSVKNISPVKKNKPFFLPKKKIELKDYSKKFNSLDIDSLDVDMSDLRARQKYLKQELNNFESYKNLRAAGYKFKPNSNYGKVGNQYPYIYEGKLEDYLDDKLQSKLQQLNSEFTNRITIEKGFFDSMINPIKNTSSGDSPRRYTIIQNELKNDPELLILEKFGFKPNPKFGLAPNEQPYKFILPRNLNLTDELEQKIVKKVEELDKRFRKRLGINLDDLDKLEIPNFKGKYKKVKEKILNDFDSFDFREFLDDIRLNLFRKKPVKTTTEIPIPKSKAQEITKYQLLQRSLNDSLKNLKKLPNYKKIKKIQSLIEVNPLFLKNKEELQLPYKFKSLKPDDKENIKILESLNNQTMKDLGRINNLFKGVDGDFLSS
jgi:hypothetical protein